MRPDDAPTTSPTTISCDDCVMQHSEHCADCIVTLLWRDTEGTAVVIEAGEARALRLLSKAGLAPELRHTPRQGPRGPEGQLLRSG